MSHFFQQVWNTIGDIFQFLLGLFVFIAMVASWFNSNSSNVVTNHLNEEDLDDDPRLGPKTGDALQKEFRKWTNGIS